MAAALRTNLGTFLIYVGCAATIFLPRIMQGYVLAPEDDFVQNFPAYASPGYLWTPLLLSGFPILADPQAQFFYPFAWLARLLPLGSGLTTNFSIYVISAYVLAAFFAAALARRLTGSFYGGVLAGLTYAFSGYMISELKHVQVLHSAVWLPAILYLIEILHDGESFKRDRFKSLWICALSLVVALTIFAGHPQTALYVFSAAAAFALLRCSVCKKPAFFLGAIAFAFAAGIGISAVQLLPSIELSSFSVRSAFTLRDFVVGQVEPLQVIGFVFPYILGGAYGTIGDLPFSEQGPPPGLMFFGFAPLILAGIVIIAALKKWRAKEMDQHAAVVLFFAFLALFAFTLSLGEHTPLAYLVQKLPAWGSFRGLYRVLILFAFALSMLCAYGLAHIERLYCSVPVAREGLEFSKLGPIKHLCLCLYVLCSCFSYPFLLGTLPLLLFFFKAKRLSVLTRPDKPIRQWILLFSAFAVLSTYCFNAEWTKASPKTSDFHPPALAAKYAAVTARNNTRIFTIKGLEGDRDQLPPNLSRLWKVPNATGYEPLVSKRYSRLLGIAEGGFMQPPWHISGANLALDVVSVEFLFAPWGEFSERAFDQSAKEKWKMVQAADRTLVYQNNDALPRFYLVGNTATLQAEDIYKTITTGALPDGRPFVPRAMVLLEKGPERRREQNPDVIRPSGGDAGAARSGQTISYTLDNEHLQFDLTSERACYFVLTDTYYPGWLATLDGRAVDIVPANYVQRAVFIPSGKHHLEFSYRPESLVNGRNISLGVLALLFILLLVGPDVSGVKRKAD